MVCNMHIQHRGFPLPILKYLLPRCHSHLYSVGLSITTVMHLLLLIINFIPREIFTYVLVSITRNDPFCRVRSCFISRIPFSFNRGCKLPGVTDSLSFLPYDAFLSCCTHLQHKWEWKSYTYSPCP